MNKHIHPTIAQALWPFFLVGIKTATGERGCRVQAPSSQNALEDAIDRMNIRDEEIPANGLEVTIKVTQ